MKGLYAKHKKSINIILNSYSELFFIECPTVGLCLMIASFTVINIGIAGLLSIISAYIFAKTNNMNMDFESTGILSCNTILVGLSIGYFYQLNWIVVFCIICGGIFSFIITAVFTQYFKNSLNLTTLTMPFAVISSITFFVAKNQLLLSAPALSDYEKFLVYDVGKLSNLPVWIKGFFISLGTITFNSNVFTGMFIALALFFYSRILLFLGFFGYILGATVSGLITNNLEAAYLNVNNFNYVLVAISLGGLFNVPSPKTLLITAVAIANTTFVMYATHVLWVRYEFIAFALPFNLVTLFFIYVLRNLEFPYANKTHLNSPEEIIDYHICNASRIKGSNRVLSLPFNGTWQVYQGIDGPWTHQGDWKYAIDFIAPNDRSIDLTTTTNLNTFGCFGREVIAPCSGRVVHVISHLVDNPPGIIDRENNWGNLVIIRSSDDYYVEISHFAQHSIVVKEGDWVVSGDLLGKCGNSGYSPRPHIHLQVQPNEKIGATTVPFCFKGYKVDNKFVNIGVPETGQIITPTETDNQLDIKTNLNLDQCLYFCGKTSSDSKSEILSYKVSMNTQSEFYIGSELGKLYYYKSNQCFSFYRIEGNDPWLSLIFTALPTIPLAFMQGMSWEDELPLSSAYKGIKKYLLQFFQMFNHNIGSIKYRAKWERRRYITGEITFRGTTLPIEVILAHNLGFKSFSVGEKTLERIPVVKNYHPDEWI